MGTGRRGRRRERLAGWVTHAGTTQPTQSGALVLSPPPAPRSPRAHRAEYVPGMRALVNYFLRGLVVVAPLAFTAYVCWRLFVLIDGWLPFSVPGVGFVATIGFFILVGFLASTFLARGLFAVVESVLSRLPFVRLVYASTKDLLNAFVGEHRRFDKPVLVAVLPEAGGRAIGFVTQNALEHLGLGGDVAVYFPFSYSVAGHVLLFPADRVHPLAADSAEVMAFIVSGGVTSLPGPVPAGSPRKVAELADA